MSYVCAGKSFKSLSDAKVYAELVFKSKGIVVAIEAKPKKLSKKQAAALAKVRMNRAIIGFQIPMLQIPAIYKALEAAIAENKSDNEVRAIVAAYPGVKESV